MEKVKNIISEGMLFCCGMCAGKLVFCNMELWKAILVCFSIFVTLWFFWDNVTEGEKNRPQKEKKKGKEGKVA